MTINGFSPYYEFIPEPRMLVMYEGMLLQQLVKQPVYAVEEFDPLMSEFWHRQSLRVS